MQLERAKKSTIYIVPVLHIYMLDGQFTKLITGFKIYAYISGKLYNYWLVSTTYFLHFYVLKVHIIFLLFTYIYL